MEPQAAPSNRQSLSPQIGGDGVALLGADIDGDAEPGFEAHAALVQQHAEPVDAAIAAAARGRQQPGFERRVDDVVDRRRVRQALEIEVEASFMRRYWPCRMSETSGLKPPAAAGGETAPCCGDGLFSWADSAAASRCSSDSMRDS